MEPEAHSTAASIQTSGFDYGRYATYYTLNNLSHWYPDLWVNLVDLAYNDLHSNYVFSGDEYPLERLLETPLQEQARKGIVREWRGVIKGLPATAKQKANILNMVFYAIWAQDISICRTSFTKTPSTSSSHPPESRSTPSRTSPSVQGPVTQTIRMDRGHPRRNGTSSNTQDAVTERLEPDVRPGKILQHLLRRVAEKFGDRYSGWLAEHPNAEKELLSFLRPEVWDICKKIEKEGFTLNQLLSISGDLSHEGPAIYLHIIWDPLTGLWSYNLYVGQSENLKERLKRHQNPWYRTKHPSLHYHVWDSLPAKESAFVVLAQGAKLNSITLNLLEAWGALIFQTLPKKSLLEDLPKGRSYFHRQEAI